MVSERVAVAWRESITWTVKVKVLTVVGVPLIVPEGLSVRPSGRAPIVTDHVYGETPPEAVNAAEYATPAVASGSLSVVTDSEDG
jgi:hypothetical protein